MSGFLVVLAFLALFMLGFPVVLAIGLPSIAYLLLNDLPLQMVAQRTLYALDSFPLVAVLAYLCIRMTGLKGPLAIALAVAFTFIPFHWGRSLGHTYLATLYSAVIGLALVLMVISGPLLILT